VLARLQERRASPLPRGQLGIPELRGIRVALISHFDELDDRDLAGVRLEQVVQGVDRGARNRLRRETPAEPR
jgi:hypothetical protein